MNIKITSILEEKLELSYIKRNKWKSIGSSNTGTDLVKSHSSDVLLSSLKSNKDNNLYLNYDTPKHKMTNYDNDYFLTYDGSKYSNKLSKALTIKSPMIHSNMNCIPYMDTLTFNPLSTLSVISIKTVREEMTNDMINKVFNSDMSTYNHINFKQLLIDKPKKELILTTFGLFFKDNYFYNHLFVKEVMKNYNYKLEDKDKNNKTQLNYPIKIRNMFNQSYVRSFVKPNLKFFDNFFEISHDYIESNNIQQDNNTILIRNKFISEEGNIIREYPCEFISLDGVIFGTLIITYEYIIFKSKFSDIYHPEIKTRYNVMLEYIFSSLETDVIFKEKEIKFYIKDMKEIINRRFLFMWQANEIFLKNGRSYFFNLFRTEANEDFFDILKDKINNVDITIINNVKKHFNKSGLTKKWLDGQISNLEYLLLINKYGSRSYHDINQYPIFPWIITNYKNFEEYKNLPNDEKDKKLQLNLFRNLSYPVSVQTEEKRIQAMKKYEDDKEEKFKLHFRCHYSTSAFTCYYLMRLPPFTENLIKLQNMKFDHPNRMFMNLKETWEILERYSDNRELTPEFFNQPEILINLNCNNFGVRNSDGRRVDDLLLPDNVSNSVDFIYKHRAILESKNISCFINYWIDNVFGSNQLAKNKDSVNIFNKYSYEQETNLEKKLEKYDKKKKLKDKEIVQKLRDKINSILNFGQTPYKLFDDKHPRKIYNTKGINNDEFFFLSDMIFSKQKLELEKFKKGVKYFNFSQSYLYVLNGEKEIEILEKQFFKKKSKIRLKNYTYLNAFTLKKDILLPIYREKYLLVELQDTKYFIVGRYLDNSFKIYYGDTNIKEILCDSFVCCIAKSSNEDKIFTGHNNGKIICWNVIYDKTDIKLYPYKEFMAHEDAVNCILINNKLNIFLSGGEDGNVFIRNLHDFELMNWITPKYDKTNQDKLIKIIDIKISPYDLLYITGFYKDEFILFGYSLNGYSFCQYTGLINNIDFTNSGKLIIGKYNSNKLSILDPINFKEVIYDKIVEETEDILVMTYFSYTTVNAYYDGNFKRTIINNEVELKHFS